MVVIGTARLALVAVLASCNLGIGSDPRRDEPSPCLPGTTRVGTTCVVPRATIVIDGAVDDWSAIEPLAVESTCSSGPCDGFAPTALRIAVTPDADRVVVMADFEAPLSQTDPALRVVLTLAASPDRPEISGVDRLIMAADGLHYEKNGYSVRAAVPGMFGLAFTPTGFEAAIRSGWLPHQNAARISTTIERRTNDVWAPVVTMTPRDACWDENATGDCEVR